MPATPIWEIVASALQQQGYGLPRKGANTVASTWQAGIAEPGNNTAGILALNVQELLLKEALLDSTDQELLLKDSEALLVLRFLVHLAFLFTCLPQVEIGIVQAREKMLLYYELSKEKKQIWNNRRLQRHLHVTLDMCWRESSVQRRAGGRLRCVCANTYTRVTFFARSACPAEEMVYTQLRHSCRVSHRLWPRCFRRKACVCENANRMVRLVWRMAFHTTSRRKGD